MRQLLVKRPNADIKAYIEDFRSCLSTDIQGDMAYSYKVFLVPMVGSHRSRDALAVEFAHFDPQTAKEYDKVVTLIKQRTVPVVNPGKFRPVDVVLRVAEKIAPKVFTMDVHTRAWRYWKVRPRGSCANPEDCNTKYCQFDIPHRDYVYTEEWVDFLVQQLADDVTYNRVRHYRPQDD